MIKMAILGAGGIASVMARTIAQMDNVEAYAVAARDIDRAEEFAEKYGFKKAYGSYEEMLADEEVQLVHVATPHSHHFRHAKMCLEAGKHVLCEKAFTVNADQARELFALAKEKNLLITEAIWTRYLPFRKMIQDIIASGVIGDVLSLTATLGYPIPRTAERVWKRELAGGALLDVSVYVINFARMVMGDKMIEARGEAVFSDGVDVADSISLVFEGNKIASLLGTIWASTDVTGSIFGSNGRIEVVDINNPKCITVFNKEQQEIASYATPEQTTGYEYEVEACIRAIENGDLECPEMPHEETIKVMEIMDSMRRSWNYEIPLLS